MRILVVGAGATGGYFGARLALAGRDVTFLVRKNRAKTLETRGLRLTGVDNETIQPTLITTDDLTDTYDLILLSVKSTALAAAIEDLAPAVGPTTTIIPFLNGMAHLDILNTRFGPDRVLGGVVFIATTVNDDGDIVRLDQMAALTVGEQNGQQTDRLRETEKALSQAGFDFSLSDDIIAAMWSKWVFITTVGGVTCLMRGTIGDVMSVPGGAELGPTFAAEGAAVADAAGFPVPDGQLAALNARVTANGAPTTSSMYRDMSSGRPTEVEHVFGDLIARARRLSVPTLLLDLATMHLRVHEHRL